MSTPTTTSAAAAGPTFRAARVGAGLGVRALAARVQRSHSTLSRWERGERDISDDTYELISDALADYLAGKWTA